ncbi:MAG: signal recognition particle-docking protein FtsY [Vicinamibacteria bacterium]
MRVFERLKEGLARTRGTLASGLGLATAGDEPDWDQLEEALVAADVGVAATVELVEALRSTWGRRPDEDIRAVLSNEILAILRHTSPDGLRTAAVPPNVVLVVGVNGVGKTTTVARLAHRAARAGRKSLIVAADTFRAAALEQLETWANRLGVDLIRGDEGTDPAAVVHEGLQAAVARSVDDVFVDTAGRLHTKKPLMDELAKVKRVAGRLIPEAPHQTLLVMDATVGGNGLVQAQRFSESLGVDGIVLTKLDGTAKGGIVVAVARELGLPVVYAGVGQGEDDLMDFSAEQFVDALVGEEISS